MASVGLSGTKSFSNILLGCPTKMVQAPKTGSLFFQGHRTTEHGTDLRKASFLLRGILGSMLVRGVNLVFEHAQPTVLELFWSAR